MESILTSESFHTKSECSSSSSLTGEMLHNNGSTCPPGEDPPKQEDEGAVGLTSSQAEQAKKWYLDMLQGRAEELLIDAEVAMSHR